MSTHTDGIETGFADRMSYGDDLRLDALLGAKSAPMMEPHHHCPNLLARALGRSFFPELWSVRTKL